MITYHIKLCLSVCLRLKIINGGWKNIFSIILKWINDNINNTDDIFIEKFSK